MINETDCTPFMLEPKGRLRFRSQYYLWKHVEKHVFNREEKWRTIDGIETELIHAAEKGDKNAQRQLARAYRTILAESVIQCCAEGKNHLHLFMIFPENVAKCFEMKGRNPMLCIRCLDISKKLVIILKAPVRNGSVNEYRIVTGYRSYPKLKGKTWLKTELARKEENGDMYHGMEVHLVADHIG